MAVEDSTDVNRWGGVRSFGMLGLVVVAMVMGLPAAGTAQDDSRLRVFLDCQTRGCAQSEFRTEITFVDWVRERTAADVHVILTSQGTGAGQEFVFDFIGRDDLSGVDLRLERSVPSTDTRDEELDALVRTFKAGLVSYVARRGYVDQLDIRALDLDEDEEDAAPRVQDDPWNMWVFTLGTDFEADGEEQESSYEVGGRISANRTTHDWKIDIEVDGQSERRTFELSSGEQTFETNNWQAAALAVRSLTPHLSAGAEIEANTSTRLNREIGGRTALAGEWNYYPYEQANRRQLLVHYQLGYSLVEYQDTTVLGKLEDSLFDQRLILAYDTRQPWGDAGFNIRYSSYLHDFSLYRMSVGGELSVRLFRGLELDLRGGYDRIRDQIYLPLADLDDEEKLVGFRQLSTGYEYQISVGLSYRFGSIFNNVVNNRFPWVVRGSGGGDFR